MKTVKIIRLDIENFKGIQQLSLELNGKSASIYGDNATGKTSIYDALTWLLFGKDSKGNSKFAVKPLDADGTTRPGVMPTVTAVLDVDGTRVTFRKQLREKWEKHRGVEERYAGNTTDYYVDDVPYKENQYKARVSEIIDEDVFRVLTSTARFCRDINWKERRHILFDLANVASDDELLMDPQFTDIRAEIGTRSMDDFRAMLTKQRKDTNSLLNQLPARIDECEHQLAGLPEQFDPAERDILNVQIADLHGQLAALDNSEARSALQNDIRALELSMRELDAENEQHRRSQDVPVFDERPALCREIERAKAAMESSQRQNERFRADIANAENRLADFRERWHTEKHKTFSGGTCPTCGQKLPDSQLKSARDKFEQTRKTAMDQLVSDSGYIKKRIAEDEAALSTAQAAVTSTANEIKKLEEQLKAVKEPDAIIIEDLPDYAARRDDLIKKISRKRKESNDWLAHVQVERDRIISEIRNAENLRAEQENIASCVELRKSLELRITEIEHEQRAKAAYIEHIDNLLDLCEEFVRYKIDRVSSEVNGKFRLVSFRLFTEAINGNLQDCCDAMVHGVPYSDLNNAMQINAGLDCICTLSEFYGVSVPLFVDNAESVTNLYALDTQTIRLIVSEKDYELRCEV